MMGGRVSRSINLCNAVTMILWESGFGKHCTHFTKTYLFSNDLQVVLWSIFFFKQRHLFGM